MMAQPPAAPPLPEQKVWRRHPVVLLRMAFLPFAGLLTLLVAWAVGGTTNGTWVRVSLGVGSFVLLWRTAVAIRVPRLDPQAPASQRQGVLQRVTTLVRWIMATTAMGLVAGALISVLASFLAPAWSKMVSVVYFFWLFFVALWLTLNTVDFRNDIYILTHDRIIDQVRFPLLYDQRTEARLDQVQNVRYTQGFWGGLLGFGDVTVETAGRTQPVVFLEVPNPLNIQQTIFRYIDQLNERREAQEAARQHEQLSKWFRAYHAVVGWIEILDLPEEVVFPHPIHVRWRINLGPGQKYQTWLSYDTESDAQGHEHANSTSPISNSGRRQFHQIIPVEHRGVMFVRAHVRLLPPDGASENGENFASREMMVWVG